LSRPSHRGSPILIAAILHRGSSISITMSLGRLLHRSLLPRTEIKLTRFAGRDLPNVAHFAPALVQIRYSPAHQERFDRSTRLVASGVSRSTEAVFNSLKRATLAAHCKSPQPQHSASTVLHSTNLYV
jgi:hypothetical protein